MTSNVVPLRKIKIKMTYLFPRGFNYDDENDDNGKGSCSSMIIMIVTFINHNTSNLYHYTNLYPPTFWWNNSNTIFSWYIVYITLDSWFREPTFEKLGDDNMSFNSCDWIFYFIFSVRLFTATKNWRWSPVHSIWRLMKLFIYFVFQNNIKGVDWEICPRLKDMEPGIILTSLTFNYLQTLIVLIKVA